MQLTHTTIVPGNQVLCYSSLTDKYLLHVINWRDIEELETCRSMFNKVHKPIPLTNELLEGNECFGHCSGSFRIQGQPADIMQSSPNLFLIRFDFNGTIRKIRYVHELENFMRFALGLDGWKMDLKNLKLG